MANKADRQYFENFTAAADYTCQASRYLVECLNNFNLDNIKAMLETMHEFEHKGDDKHHEMSGMLAKAFVTPVDREDLAMISQSIDEVLDKLEEVLQRFYVDQIRVIIPDAITFASKLQNCCELLKGIMEEFINFKKPAKHCTDVIDIISWREIFDYMEDCADACEHVGNYVELVVLKNT